MLDTRKTTPGMRMLEKQAVKIGGGCNHRIGLFDMILLKDNHVDFSGGIVNAIDRCHKYLEEKGLNLKIEIEVRSFDELQQVLDHGGVDRIMLDNFTVPDTKKAYLRYHPRLCRTGCRLYLCRCAHTLRQGSRHVVQGLLIFRHKNIRNIRRLRYYQAQKYVLLFLCLK